MQMQNAVIKFLVQDLAERMNKDATEDGEVTTVEMEKAYVIEQLKMELNLTDEDCEELAKIIELK